MSMSTASSLGSCPRHEPSRPYAVNGLNQYGTAGTASFCHDANGNLTADGTSVYKYDIENRLVEKRVQTSATCPTNSSGYSGTLQASLTYDPLGRLWQVTGATTNTRFLYDGDELVAEYDSAGTMARRYVHSDNVDDPVVQYDGAAVGASYRRFLMPDERGSIAGLIANDGTSIAKNTYDEYGIPGTANVGRFQYTGQIWLPELGMYYYKARIYSPTLGRFLQVDPIGYEDQVNLYAYVANDPMNLIDPTGMVDRPMCPGNDPYCTVPELVMAPLTGAESAENERIKGLDQPSGTLLELAGSAIAYDIYDTLSEIAPADAVDNAATAFQIGAQGEAAVASEIAAHGWTIVGTQVYIKTAAGMRVADFVVEDGQGGSILIEVKVNSATRSFSQARKDHIIQEHGGVVRSRTGAIPIGSTIRAPTAVIRVEVPR